MPRINLGIDAELILEAERKFALEIRFGIGLGPMALTFRPGAGENPFSLAQVVGALGKLLGIPALENLSNVGTGVWKGFFDISILPELTVVLDREESSIQARFQLYTRPIRDDKYYGIRISDYLPKEFTIEPDITIYDLIVGYWKKDGLDLKARVKIPPQKTENALIDGTVLRIRDGEVKEKTEVVKYPFPTPGQGGPLFKVNYLGLGQRFGPPAIGPVSDPIAKLFEELEGLRSNEPSTVLNELVEKYYRPDRNWFFGADIDVKGWRVQAIFNDPGMYGLRITCNQPSTFDGFKFEILYQKLGPDLGVYYGAISVPEKFRNINLGAVALKLPSFEIWIYTNGDFKIAVGWPLGPNSIGFEIYIFIGGCAFYIAKLRTGFNPRAPKDTCTHQPTVYYDPIVAFGLAVKIGLGRTLNAGPLRAELSLTLQGIFQGILAWEGVAPSRLNHPDAEIRTPARIMAESQSITRAPDYFWFSATVGIVGVLQGEVDLKILKVGILVRLSVTAGVAFETGYASIIQVTATVKAEASIKILFVKISVKFSLTLTETFQLSGGSRRASIEGPQNESFGGIVPQPRRVALIHDARLLLADAEPAQLDVHMVLFPAALYRSGTGRSNIVALPMIAPPKGDGTSAYDQLLVLYGTWLLRDLAPQEHSWSEVLATLGQGRDAPPDGFTDKLYRFLEEETSFTLHGVDFSNADQDEIDLLPLPMFPPMAMTVPGQEDPIVFAEEIVPDGYAEEVRTYFDNLSLSGIGSNPDLMNRLAAEPEPKRPSFVELTFTEFFLMLGRDMARRLAEPPPKEEGPTGAPDTDILSIADQLAGMATRTLLGGVLLPDPKEILKLTDNPDDVELLGFYEIARQMVPAVTDDPVNTITFTVTDPDAPLASAIHFAADDKAESKIPVAPAPPAPNPIWHGTGLTASVADITISPLAPVNTVRRWFASRERERWDDGGTPHFLLLPPPELQALADVRPVTLFAQREEPDQTAPPEPDITLAPGLFIQFRIRKVTTLTGGQVDGEGTVQPAILKGVYEISTTDDATRDRIGRLLDGPEIGRTALKLVRTGEDGGYTTLPTAASEASVFLFKTNLSTLTQPQTLFRPMARLAAGAEEIDEAPIANVAAFLRLIWQASVVNASGFYLHYMKGDDPLPEEMFDDGGTAVLTVLAEATDQRALMASDNALLVPGDAKNTIFIAADTAEGAPVEAHQSAYPPGCVAFQIDWRTAPSLTLAATERPPPYGSDTIAALYDMIQFRIDGTGEPGGFDASLWSLPLSRAKDGAGDADDAGPGTYRQVVPVFRFVAGVEESLYSAIGKQPKLEFRLLDTYGNALADAAHTSGFHALYHDPLVPLGEWPGTRVAYRVENDRAGTPALYVMLDFQPGEVVRPEVHVYLALAPGEADKARQQAQVARHRYALILAQLRDPNVTVRMLSTLFGPLGPVSEDSGLKAVLAAFASEVVSDLDAFIENGTPLAERRTEIGVPFDRARLAGQPDTIFAVAVTAEIARTAHVDPDAAAKIPGIARALWEVPPDLNTPDKAAAEDDPPEVDLRAFATRFETAFDGFDGAGGTLKLATRNGASDFAATEAVPVLWGVKLSDSQGLGVSFEHDEAAYFSPVPISNKLEVHEGVHVTIWDDKLEAHTERRAFSGIDIDAWARGFLEAMDRLLSPGTSSAIIRADATRFPSLGIAKRLLAGCLKAGVEPILKPAAPETAPSVFGLRNVIEGDLDSARDRFEQQVLTRLAAGYDSLVVLQVPAHVTNAQKDPPPEASAPRIFGGVTAKKAAAGEAPSGAFSVTNTRLLSIPGPDGGPRYANFLVSAVNPSEQARLDLDLIWHVGFIEHRLDPSHASGGYVPSSWLRVIDTPAAERLRFPLHPVSVPIPTIGYPSAPVLTSHAAVQQGNGVSKDLFLWRYDADLRKPDRDAKDTLFVRLTLNERVQVAALPNLRAKGPGEKGDVVPLFEALAQFSVAWPELEHLVEALVADRLDAKLAVKLIGIIEELLRDVSICWAGFRGVPIPDVWATFAAPRRMPRSTPPAERVLTYEIDFENAYRPSEPQLIVAAEEGTDLWPTINGATGKLGEEPNTRIYAFNDRGEDVSLQWPGLDALGQQTARLASWIVRNSNLGTKGETVTNESLVYRTAPTTFASPVIPRLHVAEYRNPDRYETLAETLCRTLDVVLGVASTIRNERSVKLETSYEYTYIADPRRSGTALAAKVPLLLSDGIDIDLSGEGDEDSVHDIAAKIAKDVTLWRQTHALPTRSADLVQKLTLFAVIQDVHQPILTIDRILYKVPEGWWSE